MLTIRNSIVQKLLTLIGVGMSVFQLYVAFMGPPQAYVMRGIHLAFAIALAYLMFPGFRRRETVSLFDLIIMLLSVAASLYPAVFVDYMVNRMYYVDDPNLLDNIFGWTLIILLMEATRRVTGWALPAIALAFFVYAITWGNQSFDIVLDQLYLTTEGVFGIPLYISATYVMLFILFGTFVERSGAGQLFMDFALAFTGSSAGGPAKVAVVTSTLFGTVSGSATANVMTTGVFTIPMMMRPGYKPGFSGGVEAVSSTGGQLMPHIMGAAAFVMAEFLGVSYITVAAFAILPAILYYVAVFMAVHFEAKRIGLKGLPTEDLPRLGDVLRERGHLFLPVVIIVVVLFSGYSAAYAALMGILSVIPTTWLRASTRQFFTIPVIIDTLAAGARNTVVVALACACAGIVIGVVTLTGLGITFTGLVLTLSQDHLVIALILTAVAGIILGMGLPTTPAYIVLVALLVPALVRLDVQVEAAHLFVLYFAVLSAITPPVALAVYAANGISRASLYDTSVAAVKLGLTGFIIPFMFVFAPSLLLIGSIPTILITTISAVIGVICLAASMHGSFFFGLTRFWERLMLFSAAILLIKPGLLTDIAGGTFIGLTIISQLVRGAPTITPEDT